MTNFEIIDKTVEKLFRIMGRNKDIISILSYNSFILRNTGIWDCIDSRGHSNIYTDLSHIRLFWGDELFVYISFPNIDCDNFNGFKWRKGFIANFNRIRDAYTYDRVSTYIAISFYPQNIFMDSDLDKLYDAFDLLKERLK